MTVLLLLIACCSIAAAITLLVFRPSRLCPRCAHLMMSLDDCPRCSDNDDDDEDVTPARC